MWAALAGRSQIDSAESWLVFILKPGKSYQSICSAGWRCRPEDKGSSCGLVGNDGVRVGDQFDGRVPFIDDSIAVVDACLRCVSYGVVSSCRQRSLRGLRCVARVIGLRHRCVTVGHHVQCRPRVAIVFAEHIADVDARDRHADDVACEACGEVVRKSRMRPKTVWMKGRSHRVRRCSCRCG